MINRKCNYLAFVVLAFGTPVFLANGLQAATFSSTASVTIGAGGSVGATPVETVTVTTTPAANTIGGTNGDGGIATATGDAVTVQTSTFRPLPTTPAATTGSTTASSSSITTQSGASTSSTAALSASAQRFNDGARAASNLFGGTSSVSVSGIPNQTYNITLPGKTAFSTGAEVVDIGGFGHNAGSTPQLSQSGAGSFQVAAQVNEAGSFETGGAEDAGDGGNGDGSDAGDVGDVGSVEQILATPVVTRSPFVSIIVSYN